MQCMSCLFEHIHIFSRTHSQTAANIVAHAVGIVGIKQICISSGVTGAAIFAAADIICSFASQSASESLVDGLFSVLVTLGVVPIIRCPRVRLI